MNSEELISIVMPSYNSKLYIMHSIESVISQTYKNWELIIVDDNSSDNSQEMLNSIQDSRVRVIFLDKNVGAGIARNEGIKEVKGKYVAFIDSDDIWLNNKLAVQYQFMRLHPKCAISYTSYKFINEGGQIISGGVIAAKSLDLNSYMQTTGIGLSTSMINRNVVGNIAFSSLRLRQDARLWIELLMCNYQALGIQDILVHYRKREGQISGNKAKAAWRTFKLYWSFKEISVYRRVYNFVCYAYNGIKKRC